MRKLNRMFAIRADLLLDHQWHEIVLHFPIPSCTQRGLHSNERLTCNANTLVLCRRGLHATNHIGSPNMFWHTADIWNAYSLPVSLHACPLFLSTSSVDFSPTCVSVANETAISNKGFGSLLALVRSLTCMHSNVDSQGWTLSEEFGALLALVRLFVYGSAVDGQIEFMSICLGAQLAFLRFLTYVLSNVENWTFIIR